MSTLDRSGVIVTCAQCGRANRLAYGALDKTTRCGQCRNPIAAPGTPIEVADAAAFDAAMRASALPLLVDFWAPWCGPCRMVAPIVDELSDEYDGKVKFVKLNTDENVRTASQYGIRSIPTLLVFKGGAPVGQIIGFRPKSDLKKRLDAAL